MEQKIVKFKIGDCVRQNNFLTYCNYYVTAVHITPEGIYYSLGKEKESVFDYNNDSPFEWYNQDVLDKA